MFVSRSRLKDRKTFPEASADWALDSGAFTEISMHGRYTFTEREYALDIDRFADNVGRLQWAAPMDWMCEPHILAKTGLSIADHHRKTIESLEALQDVGTKVPVIPVLQGWTPDDYERHADLYEARGHELAGRTVGVGSVCRRQGVNGAQEIVRRLHVRGIRIHGFGLKTTALRSLTPILESADSMSWSFVARRERRRLKTCTHATCANCFEFALRWREYVLNEGPHYSHYCCGNPIEELRRMDYEVKARVWLDYTVAVEADNLIEAANRAGEELKSALMAMSEDFALAGSTWLSAAIVDAPESAPAAPAPQDEPKPKRKYTRRAKAEDEPAVIAPGAHDDVDPSVRTVKESDVSDLAMGQGVHVWAPDDGVLTCGRCGSTWPFEDSAPAAGCLGKIATVTPLEPQGAPLPPPPPMPPLPVNG